jgi:tRNA isopentenyl-2-thiomethyl-A-37 hydroxylase MiaE
MTQDWRHECGYKKELLTRNAPCLVFPASNFSPGLKKVIVDREPTLLAMPLIIKL